MYVTKQSKIQTYIQFHEHVTVHTPLTAELFRYKVVLCFG